MRRILGTRRIETAAELHARQVQRDEVRSQHDKWTTGSRHALPGTGQHIVIR